MGRMQKYYEEILRHRAVTDEGKPCEILERVTWERELDASGAQVGAKEVNRRYDMRTGERMNRISATEFQDDESGARVQLQS
jgi:hypothetical protein